MINSILVLFSLFTAAPPCQDFEGNLLPVNNAQVLYWKINTPNQYLDRGHIYGVIGKVYPDKTGHKHFQAVIDSGTIEVVYNNEFGNVPPVSKGMTVEACGDYITSNKPTDRYMPSPDGAILHWVHRSNNPKHPHGYLRINEINY